MMQRVRLTSQQAAYLATTCQEVGGRGAVGSFSSLLQCAVCFVHAVVQPSAQHVVN